jgi:hypothetical protein
MADFKQLKFGNVKHFRRVQFPRSWSSGVAAGEIRGTDGAIIDGLVRVAGGWSRKHKLV